MTKDYELSDNAFCDPSRRTLDSANNIYFTKVFAGILNEFYTYSNQGNASWNSSDNFFRVVTFPRISPVHQGLKFFLPGDRIN
jgi:hypothetical protein